MVQESSRSFFPLGLVCTMDFLSFPPWSKIFILVLSPAVSKRGRAGNGTIRYNDDDEDDDPARPHLETPRAGWADPVRFTAGPRRRLLPRGVWMSRQASPMKAAPSSCFRRSVCGGRQRPHPDPLPSVPSQGPPQPPETAGKGFL